MKLKDQMKIDPTTGNIIHHRQFDSQPSLREVKQIRDQGFDKADAANVPESKLVARLPMWLFNEILKEAGVKWDDPAAKQVLMRALQNPDYAKFRVWEGNLGREADSKIVTGPKTPEIFTG